LLEQRAVEGYAFDAELEFPELFTPLESIVVESRVATVLEVLQTELVHHLFRGRLQRLVPGVLAPFSTHLVHDHFQHRPGCPGGRHAPIPVNRNVPFFCR
jgi:hypothetical protein